MRKLAIYSPEPEWPESADDISEFEEPGTTRYQYMFFPHPYPVLPNFGCPIFCTG